METTFHTNANDLDTSFIESIKTLYKGKEITITVDEIPNIDDLLSVPENRDQLREAVQRVEAGIGIVTPDQEQFR